MVIDNIYASQEELDTIEEYLKYSDLSVDEYELLVFCIYSQIDITSENLDKIQYEDGTFTFEDESLTFISKYGDEYYDAEDNFYSDMMYEELRGVSEIIKDCIDSDAFYDAIAEYYDFEESGNLNIINLYIGNSFEDSFCIE